MLARAVFLFARTGDRSQRTTVNHESTRGFCALLFVHVFISLVTCTLYARGSNFKLTVSPPHALAPPSGGCSVW